MNNKKHISMNMTFEVDFEKPLTDNEITEIMKEVNLILEHPLVNNISLRKLSK
tara:strand:+ start:2307 stop:2465 length:159 start_codon:yes stop_codon:yes gene_type:complete